MTHQDLLAWQQIVQVSIGIDPGAWVPLVGQDPRRVVLIMANGALDHSISLTTDPNVDFSLGIRLGGTTSQTPLVLNYREHGALVKVAWWAFGGTSTTATAISVLMELDPCTNSNWGGSNDMGSKPAKAKRVQPLRGGSDNGHRPVQPFAKAVGADIIAHVFEQADARLRRRRDRGRRDNDLPWHGHS